MHCPFCHKPDTRVVDSRLTEEGSQVRRRRQCETCNERFTTFESVEFKLPMIVKHDGRREAFDARGEEEVAGLVQPKDEPRLPHDGRREAFDATKLRSSLERCLHKRPASATSIDAAIAAITKRLRAVGDREVPARRVGDWVMSELRRIDQVAYVRFASVYRRFEDVQAFREEVEQLERDLPSLSDKQMSLLDDVAPGSERGKP